MCFLGAKKYNRIVMLYLGGLKDFFHFNSVPFIYMVNRWRDKLTDQLLELLSGLKMRNCKYLAGLAICEDFCKNRAGAVFVKEQINVRDIS